MSSDFNPSNYLLLNPEIEIDSNITTVEQAQQHYQQYGQQQQLKYDLSIVPSQFNSTIYYNDCIAQNLFSDTSVIRQDVVQYLTYNSQIQRLCLVHFVRKGIQIYNQDYTSLYIDVDPNFNYDLYTLFYKYTDTWTYIDTFNDYVTQIRNKNGRVQQINDFLIASGENPVADFKTIKVKGIPINYISDRGKMFDVNSGIPANETISTQRAIKEYVDFHCRQYTVADVSTNQEYNVQYSNYKDLVFQQKISNQINNLTLKVNNKVVFKDQNSHKEQNGLYTVVTLESDSNYLTFTRTVDFDEDYSINSGNQFFDSTNNKLYICTNTESISFSQLTPIQFDDYYYRDFETPQTVYQLYIINGLTTTTGIFSNQVSLLQDQSQPPLIVTSSNLVSNLNVQYLNGQPQSYYTNACNISSGTLAVSYGGTGINSLSQGLIPFGQGTNSFSSSSNLSWDSTNSRLGICNSIPQQALDVVGNIISSSNIQFSNQLISTIPTGSPPFVISSITLVPNLNVQYLNGQPQSFYRNSSNINSGILAVSYGGTGVNTLTMGYIPFGQGSNSLGSTSNLFWNSISNFLGIGTTTPSQALDIQSGGLRLQSWNQISQPGAHIQWNRNGSSGQTYIINQKGPSGTGGILFGEADTSNNFTQTMILTSNGQLGIGTSNPQSLLHVAGNILGISNITANVQFISTVNTGTPPLQVNSITLVSNLNVQYLNGCNSTYYTSATSINSGTLAVSYGGTGLNALSQGYIPFGSNTNPYGSSSNLFWDSTNQRLGIKNPNPQSTIDVGGSITAISNITTSNQLVSTVSYGTSPIVVTSSNLVQNLNAQYLNSNPASYYTNATNITSGTLAVSYGGTGLNSLSQGYIPFGQNTSSFGCSPNLFWNSTSNYLGVGTASPQSALHVIGNILGSYNIIASNQIISAATFGTPPFRVVSTSLVSNLNVQQLNSNTSDFYTNATSINAGTLKVAYGGTGIGSMSDGYVHFGQSNLLGQSSNLYYNYTSNYLGIGTSNPISPLYVAAISNTTPDNSGISIYSSNSNASPVVSLRQFSASSSNPSLGYISFDAYCVGGFSIGMSTNNSNVTSNITLDIRNSWNFQGTSIISFNYSSGFVGLHTSNPAALLDVNASSNTGLILRGSQTQQYIYPTSNGGKAEIGFCSMSNSTSNMWIMGQATGATAVSNTFSLYYNTPSSNSNVFTALSNGYLGIGTSNPSNVLDVAGNIRGVSNITANNQLISTVGNATPPIQVSSSNLVSNLNVQQLNYKTSDFFTNACNISSGTLSTNYGGTGLNSLSIGYIPFGQGTSNPFGYSSNLFWNQSSNMLGVNNPNPKATLDVITPTSNTCNAIVRGGLYRQLQIVPGTTIGAVNQQSEIIFNYCNDYTDLGYSCGIGINTSGCGYRNLGITAPGRGLAMTLQSDSGYVGIGTSNPANGLDVANGGLSIRGCNCNNIQIFSSNNSEIDCFLPGSSSNKWVLGQGTYTSTSNFGLGNDTKSNVMTALYSNGFIGIGTSNPASMLDIVSSGVNYPLTIRAGISNSNRHIRIIPYSNNGTTEILYQQSSTFDNVSNAFWTGVYNSGAYYGIGASNSGVFAAFTSNGYVGIGTTSPSNPLDVAGNIRASSNITANNQFVSTVLTGTSPFVINSITMVSNLNAELLGGKSQSFYTNASSINSGILSSSFGGTGLSSVPTGQLVFGSNTVSLNSSSNLFFDVNSNQLQTSQVNLTLDPTSSQAPIIVSNSNMISNLNAQYLGGKPMSYFSSTQFQYIPSGGTGISNVPVGQILFGFNSQSLNVSSNLFFDSTANQLQIPQLNLTLNSTSSQAPIVISNSNLISNLNAQYLGGFPADHFSSSFSYVPRGGTGLSNIPTGQLLFGCDSNSLNTSSNLFWDQSNFRLGVNVPQPAYPLDVNGNTNIQGNLIVSGNVIIGNNSNGSNGSTYGALSVQYGGLGVNNVPTGFIPFGYNSTQINYSSNFFWDFTNSRLGICNSNPQQALDVIGNISCSSNIYFSNQLVSTITTGTSPFNITSSTLVSNLNVQYLGGCNSSYYTNASNISSGVLAVSYGGTGINTLSQGYIPFGQGSNPLSSSSNLFWNSTSNYLGIGTSNPSSNLDIYGTGIFRNTCNQIQLYNTSNVGGCCEIKFFNWNNTLGWSIGQNTYASGVSNLSFYNGYTNSSLITLTSTNYVGINTTTPSNALDVSGNIRASSNIISSNQFVSTVAVGTAPLVVTSSNLVSNLNAQYLNGQPGSVYTNASSISSGTLSVSYGGTGINSLSKGFIPFGQGLGSNAVPNPIGVSSNLFWDSTNFRLGINNTSPQQAIDVVGNIACSSNIQAANQLVSSVLSGTAPLSVASVTLVSNLNVEQLNGQPSAYYTNASKINSGILNLTFGGTGLSSLQQGFIPFGQGSNALGSTSNLFWDSTNFRLGIRNSNPQHAIDVAGSITCSSNIYFSNQLFSSITSNSPFVVASTSMVTNLNVQYLSGKTLSDIYSSNYVCNGGTGLSNVINGYILFGNSSTALGSTSNLFWNSTSNYLGVGTNTPSNALDVIGNVRFSANLLSSNSNFYWNSTSNYLGIGTSTPSNALDVVGNVRFSSNLVSSNSNFYWNSTSNYLGIGTSTPSNALDVIGNVRFSANLLSSNSNFYWNSTSNYLGIGTSTPSNALDVVGNVRFSSNLVSSNSNFYWNSTSNYLGIGTSTPSNALDVVGNVRFSSNLISSNSNFYWNSTSNYLGIGTSTPLNALDVVGNVRFSANLVSSNSKFYWNSTSNYLGIGTSTPSNALDVVGNVRFSANLVSSNSNFYWNSTSNYLGIGTSTPSNALDVVGNVGFSANLISSNSNFYWNSTSNCLGIGTSTPIAPVYILAKSNTSPETSGLSVASSNSTISPIISLRQSNSSSTSNNLSYISFDWLNMAGFSFGMNANSVSNQSLVTLDIKNTWNFTGTSLMQFNYSTGFIGLRTSNPAALLDINAGSNTSLILRGSNTQQYIYPISNAGKSEIGFCSQSNTTSNIWLMGQATGTTAVSNTFSLYSSAFGSNVWTALSNGNFGINNSNPQATLDVISPTSNTCNAIIRGGLLKQLQIVPGTTIGSNSATNQASEIVFNQSSTYSTLDLSAAVGINTGSCGYSNLGISCPGKAVAMVFQSSTGYVGIGTSNPASCLDVLGSGTFRSNNSHLTLYSTSSSIGDICEIKFLSTSNAGWSIGQNTFNGGLSNFGIYNMYTTSSPLIITKANQIGINTPSPSYALDVTGNIRASSTIISTVTGSTTPPFTITSTALVSNLNVQYLNGKALSDIYASNYVCNGGTGLSNVSNGYILFGNGTNPLGATSNLFWNNTSNYLGIGTSSPSNGIDIANGGLSVRGSNYNSIQIFSGVNSEISCFLPNSTSNKWGFGQGSWTALSNFGLGNDKLQNVMTILYSNGFIGIGTSNPSSSLHNTGVTQTAGAIINSSYSVSTQGLHLQWNTSNLGKSYIMNQKGTASSNTGGISFGEVDTSNNFTQNMFLQSNGYLTLGVNSSNLGAMLDINAGSNASLNLRGQSTQQYIYPLSNGGKSEIAYCILSNQSNPTWWLGQGTGTSTSNSFGLNSSTYGYNIWTALSNGFFGIGTTNPQNALDVSSGSLAIRGATVANLQIYPNASSNALSEIVCYQPAANGNWALGQGSYSSGYSNFGIGNSSKGNVMTLLYSSGYVGINKTPGCTLDVGGTLYLDGNLDSAAYIHSRGNLQVDNYAQVNGTSRFNNDMTLYGNSYVQSNLRVQGWIGINDAPKWPLWVNQGAYMPPTNYGYLNPNGVAGKNSGSNAGYPNVSILATNVIATNQEFNALSDVRLKTNISPLSQQQEYDFIKLLKPVLFQWKKQQKYQYGFIAQDVLKTDREYLVNCYSNDDDNVKEEFIDEDNFLSPKGASFGISYDAFVPILTSSIQFMQQKIEQQDQQIQEQNQQLLKQQEQINKLFSIIQK